MRVVTADSLNTLRVGQRAHYTAKARGKEVAALVAVELVFSRHVNLRIEAIEEQSPFDAYWVGQTFISALGKHETLAVEDD